MSSIGTEVKYSYWRKGQKKNYSGFCCTTIAENGIYPQIAEMFISNSRSFLSQL
jgi:hypothetical protein